MLAQGSSQTTSHHQPKLLDQVRNALRTKHYALSTEKAYVDWIFQFVRFHGNRHPNQMGSQEIRSFLSYLAVKRNVASSTQNQALCAIVFLYREVLGIDPALKKGVMGVKSPADFLESTLQAGHPLAALSSTLEKEFREIVKSRYRGDVSEAIAAFVKLHGKS